MMFGQQDCLFQAVFLLFVMFSDIPAAPILSMEELVDGFRRQQMVMSSTMINASQSLGLPDRLAEAEVEEAEERSTQAFRRKNEAKTPFIATSSRLGLGYICRGYDIYKGNPVSDEGEVDQGFRLPVLDLPFNFRFTADGEYRIPDNVDVISETSASFGSSYHQVKTETDYQSMLQVDVSVHAEASGFGFSGSFMASTSYQKTVKEMTKGETTTLDIVGRANVYKARLSSAGTMSKLSDFLEDNIRALPSENCEEDAIQQRYIQLVEQFGTHYTTEVVMGAKAVQEFRFKNSDLDRFQSVGLSVKAAAELSTPFGVSGGFSVGVTNNQEMREMVSNTEKEQREYYIGGSPPSGDFTLGSTESLREWARSAAENPAPIQYKLSSIDALIKPEYFKRPISELYERRKCLRKALFMYCTRTIEANHCGLLSESYGTTNSFKFGDFVKFRNGASFLALSQHYGISPGLTIKPLTTVSAITNYDGLFQMVPPEGINKLGINVHYGEPFLLKTIEGDMLHMGKAMILNTDMPAEARLLDVLTNKDEARSVNISHSQITDFSIFLKRTKACSYVIFLYYYCYLRETPTFQVQMMGKEGTLSGFVKINCTCSKHRCGGYWFHGIIIDYDIGYISSVRIMGLYGATTDRINKLRIKNFINGVKRELSWNLGHCSGRVFEIRTSLSRRTVQTDLDLYPVQFTFHSTDKANLQGQPVKLGDTGFIHVLSSMPRKSFWDQGITQLMSVQNMGKVGIKEIGPGSHQPISTVCSGFIYPSPSDFSHRHDFSDRILISFDVNVMVNYVEIESDSEINTTDFNIQYVNEENEAFMDIHDLERTVTNNTLNLTLKSPMYTTAINVYYTKDIPDDTNITQIITMIVVSGCPKAAIDTDNTNTSKQEWKVTLSENLIQKSPYLKVITRSSNTIDPVELFKRTELPVSGSFSITVPLLESQFDCNFTAESLQSYLEKASSVSELKFENLKLTRRSHNNGEEVLVSVNLIGINLIEYNQGFMSLNSTVKSAIKSMTCNTDTGQTLPPQSESSKITNQSSSSSTSTGSIVGFTIISLLLFTILLFLVCKTYRESTDKKGIIRREYIEQPHVNRSYNEYDTEDASNEHELYINEQR
ncbi:uncharacterized protein LOC127704847 [Mytilus californianus]|uniref:uncharacterized protein LOC127704847 n=1 Tax=Mytilus californianus TaxID=6549 RepID=UPI002247D24B|nr:uncharacterized protein LOC127704847 [Mytilus californianus]XP_052065032.1 uncharacterized protein LOC127704847 [Mytilus californianus]